MQVIRQPTRPLQQVLIGPGIRCHGIQAHEDGIAVAYVGGITTWEDVVEYIMAGATAVQIGTSISWSNLDVFPRILAGVIGFMEEEGYSTLDEMRGAALEVKE